MNQSTMGLRRLGAVVIGMTLVVTSCGSEDDAATGSGRATATTTPIERGEESVTDNDKTAWLKMVGANAPQQMDPTREASPCSNGMLGLIYMAIGDRDRADGSFQRALSLDPDDAELNNNYGWYLCRTGRAQESIAYFNKALEDRLYATPAKPLHNAGICSQQMGDEPAAENYFLRAFQVDPSNAVAMFNLGELYLKRRNLERAKFYADRLLATYQPTAETLWLGLRVARAGCEQDNDARYASQLKQRFPESREAALLQRGDFGG